MIVIATITLVSVGAVNIAANTSLDNKVIWILTLTEPQENLQVEGDKYLSAWELFNPKSWNTTIIIYPRSKANETFHLGFTNFAHIGAYASPARVAGVPYAMTVGPQGMKIWTDNKNVTLTIIQRVNRKLAESEGVEIY